MPILGTVATMQAPMIIFDHVAKTVTAVPAGPTQDQRLAELAAAQRGQVTSAGGTPPKP